MRNMKFLTAAAASHTLAGCAAGSLGTTNTSMYSVHQPVVERTNLLSISTAMAVAFQRQNKTALANGLMRLRLGYGDRVSVDFGSELC